MAELEVIAGRRDEARGRRHRQRRQHTARPRRRRGRRDLARRRPGRAARVDERAPIGLGEAVETTAGDMPARWVIHAATMELGGPTSAEIIERATRSTLAKAEELGCRSLALVAFGTGVGGFPLEEAARIMVGVAREHTGASSGSCSPCTARTRSARSARRLADAARRWSRPTRSRAPSRRARWPPPSPTGLRAAGREARRAASGGRRRGHDGGARGGARRRGPHGHRARPARPAGRGGLRAAARTAPRSSRPRRRAGSASWPRTSATPGRPRRAAPAS